MQRAIRLVLAMLQQDRPATPGEIASAVNDVHLMLQGGQDPVDKGTLAREIQARVTVWQEDSVGLEDPTDHIEWLAAAKAERDWEFWDRYQRYMEDVRLLPRRVVWGVDGATDRILRSLEDPRRAGRWRRTGLVVGQVQSGKTGNFIGLACKAADAGYKLIIVMAGIHNSLRSQTQLRVDEGLLGFDTQYQQRYDDPQATSRIGVGALPGVKRLKIASLTNSAESGDFKRAAASNMGLPIGDYPVVLVVKKHASILKYIRKWIVEFEGSLTADGTRQVVSDVPVLIIDDEADNASVDTSKNDETEPSTINREIRALLNSFDKAAYVGFTATPFANIYIDSEADDDKHGQDLFPESFIENLSAPSNYLGPERVFGLRVEDPEEADIEALPVFRPIGDFQLWMPDRHKKDWTPPEPIPASLREAVNSFILTCAARRVRGQVNEHNSMLVHVTRFQDVQNKVREQIHEHVLLTRDRLRDHYSVESADLRVELKRLWEENFVPTTAKFPDDVASGVSWEAVLGELTPALRKIDVRAINGTSKDALEYYEHRKTGLSLIAVGGDKLSRGLTLEGLSVSYYLRASKAYDTLLQMGRWFGYRPGYEDLCRLYSTRDLRRAYEEITLADNDLRRQFEEMAALGLTPRSFGLRVRASAVGLAVTAANKMRRGQKVQLSYSGDISETVVFKLGDAARANADTLNRFVDRMDGLGAPTVENGSVIWRGVPPATVIEEFLDGYTADSSVTRVRPAFIAEYIRRCMLVGELSNWTVRLVSNSKGPKRKIGAREVGLVTRKATNKPEEETRYTIKRLLSPSDESRDLDKPQRDRALAATRKAAEGKTNPKGEPRNPTVPTGGPLRAQRRPDQPLLLIYPIEYKEGGPAAAPLVGFAISFPVSEHAIKTTYVVNEIWKKQEIEDLDDGDDE